MPNILKPTTLVKQITTQTVQGEVTINLNIALTLHVDQDGVKLSAEAKTSDYLAETVDYLPQIPDMEPEDLIEFGKDVED